MAFSTSYDYYGGASRDVELAMPVYETARPVRQASVPDLASRGPVYDDVFLDVGSRGYHIQSHVLGIPDHLGLFQRGAPRRNGFLGMLMVSFVGAWIWSVVLYLFYIVWLVFMSEPIESADGAVYGFLLGFLFVFALTVVGLDSLDRRWRQQRLLERMEKEMRERNGSDLV